MNFSRFCSALVRRVLTPVLSLTLVLPLIFLTAACDGGDDASGRARVTVVATIFPAYDAARSICKDIEGVQVKLLLRPGTESHTYDPTPQDIALISSCDLFVCTGGESDEWARTITEGAEMQGTVLAMLNCVDPLSESDMDGLPGSEDHTDHGHGYDEHVWTSPVNMIKICQAVAESLCKADPGNAGSYRANLDAHTKELTALDDDFRSLFEKAGHVTLVFGDRFPFRYFAEEYSLEWYAAFPGCAENTEPSGEIVTFLADKIVQDNIKTVFYIELSTHRIADTLAAETGCSTAMLHSVHNVTADEFERGETYLSLMRNNLETLREYWGNG